MFHKILIANRGEIAVRIIRACRNMGIRSVAVYSKEDQNSLHVQLADQRVCIGEGPARNNYLNMERIITAARNVGADAIHRDLDFYLKMQICPSLQRIWYRIYRSDCRSHQQYGK